MKYVWYSPELDKLAIYPFTDVGKYWTGNHFDWLGFEFIYIGDL